MEYRRYTPMEAKDDLIRKSFFYVISAIALVIGIILLIGSFAEFTKIKSIDDISTVSYENLVKNEVYYVNDLVVLEQYDNKDLILVNIPELYFSYYDGTNYLVRFTDGDGNTVYASMRETDFTELKKFYRNKELITYKGCFKLTSVNTNESECLKKAYKEHSASDKDAVLMATLKFDDAKSIGSHLFNQFAHPVLYVSISANWCLISGLLFIHFKNERKYIKQYLEAFYTTAHTVSS